MSSSDVESVKIAFLVLVSTASPWFEITNSGQIPTWLSQMDESSEYVLAHSNGVRGKSIQDGSDHRKISYPLGQVSKLLPGTTFDTSKTLECETYSGIGGLLPTSILGIRYLIANFSPDFIVRTNSSSYWNTQLLKEGAANWPKKNFYGGVTAPINGGFRGKLFRKKFVSGAGIIMSSDVAVKLCRAEERLRLDLIDDVSIGLYLNSIGIKPKELDRIDLKSLGDVNQLRPESIAKCFHFRCKSEITSKHGIKRLDTDIMHELHRRIGSLDGRK